MDRREAVAFAKEAGGCEAESYQGQRRAQGEGRRAPPPSAVDILFWIERRSLMSPAVAAGACVGSPTARSVVSVPSRWLPPRDFPSRCRRPNPVSPGMRRCSLGSRREKLPGLLLSFCKGRDSDILLGRSALG